MPILPSRTQDLLEFCNAHAQLWNSAYAEIGLSPAQAAAFKTLTNDGTTNYNAAVAADAAKRAATLTSQSTIRELRRVAGETINIIRAFAENQPNPDAVFAEAQIPAPATPTPAGPPGTPTSFRVSLLESGAVELKWKCANPIGTSGTIYEVRRKTGTDMNFTFIGATGTKKFLDETIPSGSSNTVYQITAVRSTRRGNPAQFNVNFGVGGDGQVFATVTPAGPVKMAA